VTGVFLSYVVRDVVELGNNDPGFGKPTIDAKMVRRAPHDVDAFHVDSATVWNVICHVTHDGPGRTWVSAYNHIQNGREAKRSWPSEVTIKAIPIAAT